MFAIILFSWLSYGYHDQYESDSCMCHCGEYAGKCYCDEYCLGYGDCCKDYLKQCHFYMPSCRNNCGEKVEYCYCDEDCSYYNDCCRDIEEFCTPISWDGPTVWPIGQYPDQYYDFYWYDPSACESEEESYSRDPNEWFDGKPEWIINIYGYYDDFEHFLDGALYQYGEDAGWWEEGGLYA